MAEPHPSGLRAGDRVIFRGPTVTAEEHAATFPGATVTPDPVTRAGTLTEDPRGMWVQVQYDDESRPDSALVETLTRVSS